MPGVIDQVDPRTGNSLGKFVRILWRDDAVRLAPYDQRRRGDAVNAIFEPAVGNRPDELTGAGLCPDELRERVDALRGIARNTTKRRAAALGIGESKGRARR